MLDHGPSPRLIAPVILVVALFLVVGQAPVSAASSRNCTPPKYPGSGYFTSLTVTHVSCATGKSVTVAHYRCRTKHGKAGRCGHVSGYTCHERRTAIPTEIDAIVTCTSGSRRVRYSYQQNL